MRVIWAMDRDDDALWLAGECDIDGNRLVLLFGHDELARIGRGGRPYILLGPGSLAQWPYVPADLPQREPETKIWANLRNKKAEHRPLVWRGWPLSGGLAILRPEVQCPGLERYELRQDGFLTTLRGDHGRREAEERGAV